MMIPRWLWKDGRLSWGVVAVVVYLTIWMIVVDLVWRTVKLPFETLLIYAVLVGGAAAVALIVAGRRTPRARTRPRS